MSRRKRLPRKAAGFVHRLALEELENRLAPSAVSWTGNGNDPNWNNSKNWSNGVPGKSDDVTINVPVNGTIDISGGAFAVGSLNDTSAPLDIGPGATLSIEAITPSSIFGKDVGWSGRHVSADDIERHRLSASQAGPLDIDVLEMAVVGQHWHVENRYRERGVEAVVGELAGGENAGAGGQDRVGPGKVGVAGGELSAGVDQELRSAEIVRVQEEGAGCREGAADRDSFWPDAKAGRPLLGRHRGRQTRRSWRHCR